VRYDFARAPQTTFRRAIHSRCVIAGQFEVAFMKPLKSPPSVKVLIPLDQRSGLAG